MKYNLVALFGPAGSGKTTIAKILSDKYGFERTRFASPVKAMLATFLLYQGLEDNTVREMLDGNLKEIPNIFLCNRTPRHAMQTLGSEWRDMIGKELWSEAWARTYMNPILDGMKIIVDDMRFVHEEKQVRILHGACIRILRSDLKSVGTHISEQEWKQIHPTFTITNDGPPEEAASIIWNIIK